ncbi:MAG: hypothetical protein Q9196_007249, partial [Gyalolechia fulgens]
MAGMECTDFSFPSQSFSMQGDAGTITSSRHPVLGTLLHFALKPSFESYGIQTLGGKIHPDWVARMMDVVTVAGQRFDVRDRKRFEEDEGTWLKTFSEQRVARDGIPVQGVSSAPSGTLRQRRPVKHSSSVNGDDKEHFGSQQSSSMVKSGDTLTPTVSTPITRRVQDGDWSFGLASNVLRSSGRSEHQAHIVSGACASSPTADHGNSTTLMSRLRRVFSQTPSERRRNVLPVSEPRDGSISISQAHAPTSHQLGEKETQSKDPRQFLAIKDHGEEDETTSIEPQAAKRSQRDNHRPYLLLTNGNTHGGRQWAIPSPLKSYVEIIDLEHSKARNDFVTDKWQQTFQRRRRERSKGRLQPGSEHRLLLKGKSTLDRRQSSSTQSRATREPRTSPRYPKLAIKDRIPAEKSGRRTDDSNTDDRATPRKERLVISKNRHETLMNPTSSDGDVSCAVSSGSSSPRTGSVEAVEYGTRGSYYERRQSSSSQAPKGQPSRIPEQLGQVHPRAQNRTSTEAETAQIQQQEFHDDNIVRRGRRRNSSLARHQDFSPKLDSANESDTRHPYQHESNAVGHSGKSQDPKQDQSKEVPALLPTEMNSEQSPGLPYIDILSDLLSGETSDSSELDPSKEVPALLTTEMNLEQSPQLPYIDILSDLLSGESND